MANTVFAPAAADQSVLYPQLRIQPINGISARNNRLACEKRERH
jgi:hypothetical protein